MYYVQLGVSFAGGYIAGVLCAAVSHPADVVVSKLNNLPEAAPGEPKTGAIQVAKELGWKGVWRGLGPRIVMIGTLTGLQWLFYDTFKVYVGLPTTGSTPDNDNQSKIEEIEQQISLITLSFVVNTHYCYLVTIIDGITQDYVGLGSSYLDGCANRLVLPSFGCVHHSLCKYWQGHGQ